MNPAQPKTHRILVVEDEESIALGVRDALQHAGFQADVVHDGLRALERIRAEQPDLVVLDLMLPGMTGLDILATLRKEKRMLRVVILTAMTSENDLVRGFELGADDYMKKPFSPRELVARVEAQFRHKAVDEGRPVELDLPGGIKVDLSRLEVHRDGQVLPLTPREGDILAYLIKNHHRVVTRDDLLLDVWHYKSANVETRTVDIHIVGLRRKVEPNAAEPTLIQTVRGKGYRWYS
ncbi:MAG: response regulator transcription factor [Planctomycetes bacterium]|nr:response regulator transcription factor [Planctomycetota bacterium]